MGWKMKKWIFIVIIILIGIMLVFCFTNRNNIYKIGNCKPEVTKQYLKSKEEEYHKLIYDENFNMKDAYNEGFLNKFYKDSTLDGKYDLYIFYKGVKKRILNHEDFIKYDFLGNLIDIYPKDSKAGQTEFLFIQEKNGEKVIFSLKLYEIYLSKKTIHTFSSGAASIIVQVRCMGEI